MKTERKTSLVTLNVNATSDGFKVKFVDRIAEIPVVNSAKDFGVATYNNIKQLSKITNYAFTAIETTALHITDATKPFLGSVKPHAQFVDYLACRGLDVVQEKAPFILHTPDQLIEDARKMYASTIELGYQKLEQIKSSGTQTLSSVQSYGLKKVDEYLLQADSLVDVYIPLVEGSEEGSDEGKSIPERLRKFSSKVGQRVYGHGMKQWIAIQNLSLDSLPKLAATIELGLGTQLSSFARRTSFALTTAYNVSTAPIANVSHTYQDGLNTLSLYATELLSQFDKATHAGEVTVSLLDVTQKKLISIRKFILSLRNVDIDMVYRDESSSLDESSDSSESSRSESSEDKKMQGQKDEEIQNVNISSATERLGIKHRIDEITKEIASVINLD